MQRPVAPQLRFPPRTGGHPGEDLQQLEDLQAEKENEILREIKQNMAKHTKWNEGYVDWTREPLTPSTERRTDHDFRPAITTEYLPTPPASESSDLPRDGVPDRASPVPNDKFTLVIRQKSPPPEEPSKEMPSFRRRVGRGGRMLIDRRNLPFRDKATMDPLKVDRFKYDHDDDDDDPVYERDEFDIQVMQHRAFLTAKSRDQAVAQAQLQAQAQAQAQNVRRLQNDNTGGGSSALPPASSIMSSPSIALKGPQSGN